MTGGLRFGAWLVCLGLLGAGLYLALLTPAKPAFERIDGRLLDVSVENVSTPAGQDRIHRLSLSGTACADYDYLETWAARVGLPVITLVNANEPMTIYVDPRSCAGFKAGGTAQVRALVYQGKLYATEDYLIPHNDRLANLPAAGLLLLTGAAGLFLLIHRGLARTRPATLD